MTSKPTQLNMFDAQPEPAKKKEPVKTPDPDDPDLIELIESYNSRDERDLAAGIIVSCNR